MPDATCNRAGEAGGGGVADPQRVRDFGLQWLGLGADAKDQVAIHGRVGRNQSPRHAVVCSGGHAGALGLRQIGVGGDTRDGGVVVGEFGVGQFRRGDCQQAKTTKFFIDFPRRGPEVCAVW